MAEVCSWSKRAKLIHLTTWLRGEAFAFCSTQQKGDYDSLVAELTRRFRIQSVQTSLFYDRKQRESTVMHKTSSIRLTHRHKKGVQLQRAWVDPCFLPNLWLVSIKL